MNTTAKRQREARTCGNCGAKNNENNKQCIGCGGPL